MFRKLIHKGLDLFHFLPIWSNFMPTLTKVNMTNYIELLRFSLSIYEIIPDVLCGHLSVVTVESVVDQCDVVTKTTGGQGGLEMFDVVWVHLYSQNLSNVQIWVIEANTRTDGHT